VPYAAAISMHPVPAYATGEVIGQLVEELGLRPDLLVVAARPGLAGALEDISATIRRLLDPTVLIGGIAEGVGSATSYADSGPALALWGASGGFAEPWTPGRRGRSHRDGSDRSDRSAALGGGPSVVGGPAAADIAAGDPPTGDSGASVGVLLTTRGPAPVAPWSEDDEADLAVVGGVIRGPLVLDGDIVAAGSVGARVSAGLAPRIQPLSDLGPIGPRLVVTAAVGPSILELDGQPALDRLTAVVRDHVPAGHLSRIGDELFIGEISPGRLTMPARVLGADRRNGAIFVAEGRQALEIGDAVMVQVAAPDNVERALRVGLHAVGEADGVLLFAAPGHGRPAGAGIDAYGDGVDGLESGWGLLPAATLSLEAAPRYCGRLTGTTETERAGALALFS
jgi:small ligand-binding sensory domain FIST